jgi:hypothetical protein
MSYVSLEFMSDWNYVHSKWTYVRLEFTSIPNGHMSDWNLCPFRMDTYVRLECTEYFCPSCSIAHVKPSVCRVDIVHRLGTRLSSGLLYKMPIMTINYIFAVVISQCKLRLIPKTAFAYVKH